MREKNQIHTLTKTLYISDNKITHVVLPGKEHLLKKDII